MDENTKTINLVKAALGVLFFIPALPSIAKSIAVLLLILSVLVLITQRSWHFDKSFFITNALLYFILLITLFYSDDLEYGIKRLTTMLSLLLFPLLFALINESERKAIFKNLYSYLTIYIIAVFLFNVGGFLWAYVTRPSYSFLDTIIHYPTLLNLHLGKFSMHPIYLSMHCSMALLFSCFLIKKLKSRYKVAGILIIDLTLILFLLMYAKKGPLIALFVVLFLFVVFQKKKAFFKPSILTIIILLALTITIPKTRNKFVELLKIESISTGEKTSTNIRYSIYNSALNKIEKSPFFGYGIGDYNNELYKQYRVDGLNVLAIEKYNSHNQYLSFLLIGGGVCVLAILITIAFNFIYAIRFNNQILILLLIYYGIVMLTENILEREAGVIIFSFFLNFFGMYNKELNQCE